MSRSFHYVYITAQHPNGTSYCATVKMCTCSINSNHWSK